MVVLVAVAVQCRAAIGEPKKSPARDFEKEINNLAINTCMYQVQKMHELTIVYKLRFRFSCVFLLEN